MKSIIKYLLFAVLALVFSGIIMQEDVFMQEISPAPTKEYSQYHHTQFEPQKDICIASYQISSAHCPSRLIKKNKKSASSGKCHWATLKSGKHNTSYLAPNSLYNNSVSVSSAAEPVNQFIRYCRLLI